MVSDGFTRTKSAPLPARTVLPRALHKGDTEGARAIVTLKPITVRPARESSKNRTVPDSLKVL
jgi:hypothetical protein